MCTKRIGERTRDKNVFYSNQQYNKNNKTRRIQLDMDEF